MTRVIKAPPAFFEELELSEKGKENTGRPVVLRLIKKEVKHTIKNVIVTAPQVLATYHTSPGWELIRYKIKGSTTVQMIDKDITYDDETIDMAEQK